MGALFIICAGALFYLFLPTSPQSVFERETGLDWPSSASIVSSGDDHGGFLGDGEFHLVFDVDQTSLDRIMNSRPRAPLSEWQTGSVPTEIGFHCNFGTDGVAAVSSNDGPTEYMGDAELEDVLGSSEIVYTVHERCCDSVPWHNGTLLIVDPRNRRIWFSIWDF